MISTVTEFGTNTDFPTMAHDTEDTDSGVVTRGCEHCEWTVAADSHAEMVTVYQDHLREHHPKAWLDT